MTSPDPPDTLTDPQKAIWQETTARLSPRARIDPNSLTAYCVAVTTWQQANDLLRQSQPLITRDGRVLPNPALTVMQQAATTINQFASKFHLNQPHAMQAPDQPERHTERLPCDRCGRVHNPKYCDGHRRKDGMQCTKDRGEKTSHPGYGNCGHHAGETPGGIKAADAERGRSAFFRLTKHGLPPVADPLTALAGQGAQAVAAAEAWAELANTLSSQVTMDLAGVERVRAAAEQYRRTAQDAVRVLAEMAHLNVDERLVAIQSQVSDRLVELVGAVLDSYQAGLRDRVAPLLADDAAWPSEAELEGLYASALAQAQGGG